MIHQTHHFMHTDRTRFKKDIVTEFMSPTNFKSQKVMILLDGLPSVPSKKAFMIHWAKKDFWVFHPRYRGTWESGGEFLKESPVEDVNDVVNGIKKGFKSLYSMKQFDIDPKQIVLVGSSFGGCTALMSSLNSQIDRVVALSPVVDWLDKKTNEPLESYSSYISNAFGEAYRFQKRSWNKFKTGKFLNPSLVADQMNGEKFLIFHCQDDRVVNWKEVKKFSEQTGSKLHLWKKGGHLGLSDVLRQDRILKQITKFLED